MWTWKHGLFIIAICKYQKINKNYALKQARASTDTFTIEDLTMINLEFVVIKDIFPTVSILSLLSMFYVISRAGVSIPAITYFELYWKKTYKYFFQAKKKHLKHITRPNCAFCEL